MADYRMCGNDGIDFCSEVSYDGSDRIEIDTPDSVKVELKITIYNVIWTYNMTIWFDHIIWSYNMTNFLKSISKARKTLFKIFHGQIFFDYGS